MTPEPWWLWWLLGSASVIGIGLILVAGYLHMQIETAMMEIEDKNEFH